MDKPSDVYSVYHKLYDWKRLIFIVLKSFQTIKLELQKNKTLFLVLFVKICIKVGANLASKFYKLMMKQQLSNSPTKKNLRISQTLLNLIHSKTFFGPPCL